MQALQSYHHDNNFRSFHHSKDRSNPPTFRKTRQYITTLTNSLFGLGTSSTARISEKGMTSFVFPVTQQVSSLVYLKAMFLDVSDTKARCPSTLNTLSSEDTGSRDVAVVPPLFISSLRHVSPPLFESVTAVIFRERSTLDGGDGTVATYCRGGPTGEGQLQRHAGLTLRITVHRICKI